jgi:hypothetical protein
MITIEAEHHMFCNMITIEAERHIFYIMNIYLVTFIITAENLLCGNTLIIKAENALLLPRVCY